jgi:hypothetical protein
MINILLFIGTIKGYNNQVCRQPERAMADGIFPKDQE